MSMETKEDFYERRYRDLKQLAPMLYRDVVGTACALAIQHKLSHQAAADIEKSMVNLCLDALKLSNCAEELDDIAF